MMFILAVLSARFLLLLNNVFIHGCCSSMSKSAIGTQLFDSDGAKVRLCYRR